MTWTYRQRTGELLRDGELVAKGYAGAGVCKNDPDSERLRRAGPIPRGWYTIHGPPFHGGHMGPACLGLEPSSRNCMWGRSGFAIHGDNADGTASHGCIILPRSARLAIWESGDHQLTVESGDEPQKESST